MTANRVIPYGYIIQNGQNVPHPDEVMIIRRIFADYLGGSSLLKIAQALTAEGIEFLPGRCDWNKNRVKRILEDVRYTGTGTYPAVISEDIYYKALKCKENKNNCQLSTVHCQLTSIVQSIAELFFNLPNQFAVGDFIDGKFDRFFLQCVLASFGVLGNLTGPAGGHID